MTQKLLMYYLSNNHNIPSWTLMDTVTQSHMWVQEFIQWLEMNPTTLVHLVCPRSTSL